MATRLLSTQRVVNLASDPATGTAGELYYNTTSNVFKYYNGTAWTEIVGGGEGASLTISETAPSPAASGDLWLNSTTVKLLVYYDSFWVEIGGGGGGSGGLQNIVEDLTPELGGNLNASSYDISNIDNLSFDTTPDNAAGGPATFVWDDGNGTLSLGLKGGNVNLPIGQEEVALCYNGTGATLMEGTVVYVVGAQGQRPSIAKANASSESTSSKTFGVVTETITNGAEGFVTTFGVVRGLNTSSFTEGSAIWLSTTAGEFTQTMPSSPNHAVFVGYCIRVHETSGEIFVKIQNGYELQELHNVSITSVADNNVLSYDSSTSLWKNQALVDAIKEVDGSGSEIDADTLDGQHGSYFAPINSPTFTGVVTVPTPTNATDAVTKGYVDGLPNKITVSSTVPAVATEGTLYFNSTDYVVYISFGGAWLEIGSVPPFEAGSATTTVFDTTFDGGDSLTTAFDSIYDLGDSISAELLA